MRHTSAPFGLGLLLVIMAVGSVADAAVESVSLSPAEPSAMQPFELFAAGALSDLGYALHTTPPTLRPGGYHVDLVIYRDPLALAGQAIVPFSQAIALPGLPSGDYEVVLREHTLLATDPVELAALLSDPGAYGGPIGDPFGSYHTADHTLGLTIAPLLSPEPGALALVFIGAVALVRRGR